MEEKPTGEKIRALRERKAWTQEHLAGAAGISSRTVQRAEEGVMSAETRAAIAGALDVPVESLARARKPPQGWPRIAPVLCYEDSKTAVAWLERAFGFRIPPAHDLDRHSGSEVCRLSR
jgi:transcriptional regulator with XRE-family HTH domain